MPIFSILPKNYDDICKLHTKYIIVDHHNLPVDRLTSGGGALGGGPVCNETPASFTRIRRCLSQYALHVTSLKP